MRHHGEIPPQSVPSIVRPATVQRQRDRMFVRSSMAKQCSNVNSLGTSAPKSYAAIGPA